MMNQHIVMILTIAVLLAIAAYLAFTLFRKYSSRRRRANHLVYDVDAGDTLAHSFNRVPAYRTQARPGHKPMPSSTSTPLIAPSLPIPPVARTRSNERPYS